MDAPVFNATVSEVQARLQLAADIAALMTPHPIDCLSNADTVLVFPGVGDIERLQCAAVDASINEHTWHLLVAGDNPDNSEHHVVKTRRELEELTGLLLPHMADYQSGWEQDPRKNAPLHVARFQGIARNTHEQAVWAFEQLCAVRPTGVRFYASDYHIPRAFMTLIKQMSVHKRFYKIFPQHTKPLASRSSGLSSRIGHELLLIELEKILTHRASGHVAASEEVRAYVDWLQEQAMPRMG